MRVDTPLYELPESQTGFGKEGVLLKLDSFVGTTSARPQPGGRFGGSSQLTIRGSLSAIRPRTRLLCDVAPLVLTAYVDGEGESVRIEGPENAPARLQAGQVSAIQGTVPLIVQLKHSYLPPASVKLLGGFAECWVLSDEHVESVPLGSVVEFSTHDAEVSISVAPIEPPHQFVVRYTCVVRPKGQRGEMPWAPLLTGARFVAGNADDAIQEFTRPTGRSWFVVNAEDGSVLYSGDVSVKKQANDGAIGRVEFRWHDSVERVRLPFQIQGLRFAAQSQTAK